MLQFPTPRFVLPSSPLPLLRPNLQQQQKQKPIFVSFSVASIEHSLRLKLWTCNSLTNPSTLARDEIRTVHITMCELHVLSLHTIYLT